jgi:hypothetical protein
VFSCYQQLHSNLHLQQPHYRHYRPVRTWIPRSLFQFVCVPTPVHVQIRYMKLLSLQYSRNIQQRRLRVETRFSLCPTLWNGTTNLEIEPSMIWDFHGCEYEECRLLRYKNPVRTSQEAHYFSATETSWLMLCKIWGFHGGDYEECRLLGYEKPVRTSQEAQ